MDIAGRSDGEYSVPHGSFLRGATMKSGFCVKRGVWLLHVGVLCLAQTACVPTTGGDGESPALETATQALGACADPICFDTVDTLLNTTLTGAQDQVAAASAPDGGTMVVFRDQSVVANLGDVRFRLFRPNLPLPDDQPVKPAPGGNQLNPVVAANTTSYLVVWSDNVVAANGYDIRARRFGLDGSALDAADFVVNSIPTLDQTLPAVTTLSNGDFLIAWKDGSKASPDKLLGSIRWRRLRANGTMSAAPELTANLTYTGDQLEPAVAALPTGGWVATWTCGSLAQPDNSGTQVRARVFNDSDVPLGPDFKVNISTDRDQRQSKVAAAPDGTFYVVWTDYGPLAKGTDYEIRGRRYAYDAHGVLTPGAEQTINTTLALTQSLPAIAAVPGASQYLVTWQDASKAPPDNSGTAIRGRRVPFDGTLIEEEDQVVTTLLAGNQTAPIVAAPVAGGRLLVAWTDASLVGDTLVSGIRGHWLKLSACGDGNVDQDRGETCDDANNANGDGCSSTCEIEGCGDGVVQAGAGEQCDKGADNALQGPCLPTCQLAHCGDAVTQAGEQCDDGNQVAGDGCAPNCTREVPQGYACSGLCGNGVEEAGEACDYGARNRWAGSGCSLVCTRGNIGLTDDIGGLDTGCGDLRITPARGEQCDDGNHDANDSCDPDCHLERCGNGVQDAGEECDTGFATWIDFEAVYGAARLAAGIPGYSGGYAPWVLHPVGENPTAYCAPGCVRWVCGNGRLERSSVAGLPAWAAHFWPARVAANFYDEQCDDGNLADDDGCSATCQLERCGDGVVQASRGEVCDDGAGNGGPGGCLADCSGRDLCPNDPAKTAPGICGCERPDADTDGDGTADCLDLCPDHGTKVDPGTCGCGQDDVDTDGDGVLDCLDGCPANGAATVPGACGCGTPDTTGRLCRASAGPCDVAEVCTGASVDCPADGFAAAAQVCRAAVGGCDVAETCTGASAACPADGFAPAVTVCRPAAGPCDVGELCTGAAPECPVDVLAPGTEICRPAAGPCDVAETCSGAATDCPMDAFQGPEVVCRAASGVCDVAETCTGNPSACPGDQFQPPSAVCRDAAGPCDVAEYCLGDQGTCPADAISEVDTDHDGTLDCVDGCPLNAPKVAPGICGCAMSDADTDYDTVADCHDTCPAGTSMVDRDSDGDGTADCVDGSTYPSILSAPAGAVAWEPSGVAVLGNRLWVAGDKYGWVAAYTLPLVAGANAPVASFQFLPGGATPKWEAVRVDANSNLLLLDATGRKVWRCNPATNCAAAADVTPALASTALGAVRYETLVLAGLRTWLGTRTPNPPAASSNSSKMADDLGNVVTFAAPVVNGRPYQLSDGVFTNGRFYLTWSYEAGGATINDVSGLLTVVMPDAQGRPDPATLRICRALTGKPEGIDRDGTDLVVVFDEDGGRKTPLGTFTVNQVQDFSTRVPLSACD